MPAESPRIVEQDGSIVRIVCGQIEVVAELIRHGDEIILDRFSIDGAGSGTVGLRGLYDLARQFLNLQNAKRLRIRGTTRTTGANPGKIPREIVIEV